MIEKKYKELSFLWCVETIIKFNVSNRLKLRIPLRVLQGKKSTDGNLVDISQELFDINKI